jgi:uncharacterized membrane protein YfcA
MELWQYLLLMGIGVAAGFLNVMAGGGSLLTVPIMIFMGIPGPVANGSNRIAILVQDITAIATFFRHGYSDFRLSLSLAMCAVPGAILGALFGTQLEGIWFNRVLATIMLGVMLIMTFGNSPTNDRRSPVSRKRLLWGHGLMVAVGFYGGFIQIGVGFLIMPVLNRIIGLSLVQVNMHKVFIIGSYTLAALIVFALRVEIMWLLGAVLALSYAAGAWLAVHTTLRRGERGIKIVLNVVLTLFIVKLLLDY